MYTFLSTVILLVCLLLILIVLVQKSKGGGLTAGFSSSNQVMGVRRTTDFLEKATWTLAISLVVLTVVICFTFRERESVSKLSEGIENAASEQQMQNPFAGQDIPDPFGDEGQEQGD